MALLIWCGEGPYGALFILISSLWCGAMPPVWEGFSSETLLHKECTRLQAVILVGMLPKRHGYSVTANDLPLVWEGFLVRALLHLLMDIICGVRVAGHVSSVEGLFEVFPQCARPPCPPSRYVTQGREGGDCVGRFCLAGTLLHSLA